MNLNHLAIFQAVAQAGSMTLGAERLDVSQPAVSKQVRELERALGVSLFDRVGRRVRLSQAGETLADYARRLFALAREAEEAMADVRTVRRGRLVIGASTTIGTYLLPGPALRPGLLGFSLGWPLAKGAAWRLPARVASSS
jgi:DNA-binding transcriptional LysR family regulator